MTTKNPNTKTIEISTTVYEQLHSLKTELEEIFDMKMSFDKALKVILSPKIVDYGEMLQKEVQKNVSNNGKNPNMEPKPTD